MVHECQYVYETGRKCRRIPKRGEDLCPGHRPNPRRSHHSDPGFARRLLGYADQLRLLSLEDLCCTLQDDLARIQPIVDRKSSRAAYEPFARAFVAVTVAINQLGTLRAAQASRLAAASLPGRSAAQPNPAASDASHPPPHACR